MVQIRMLFIDLLMRICSKYYERFRICRRIYDYMYDLTGTKFGRIVEKIQAGYLECPSCRFPIHCIICGSLMDAIPPHDWAVCSNEECRFGEDGLPTWLMHK